MKVRVMFFVAIGLALTIDPPTRSFGQQSGNQPNPQDGQEAQQSQDPPRQQGANPAQGQQAPNQQQGANPAQRQRSPQNLQSMFGTSQIQGQPGQNIQSLFRYRPYYANGTQHDSTYFYTYGRNHSGMHLATADDALRAQLKLPKEEGLIVTAVQAGSPAAQVGIEPNDVLLRIAGKVPQGLPLGKPEDLEEGLKAAGDTPVTLLLLRHGHRVAIKVQPRISVSLGPVRPEPPSYWIGVSVAAIEPALRSQLQIPQKNGLLALDVVKDSPGAKAGIRPHDILLKLDGEDLTDQDKLIQVVQSRGEKTVSLELIREGKKETIAITPQRRKNVQLDLSMQEPVTTNFNVLLPGAVFQDANLVGLMENIGDLQFATGQPKSPETRSR